METKDILEELYDLFQEKMPYHIDDMGIRKAQKRLKSLVEDETKKEAILNYGIAYEKSGFRYGFTLAVRIMAQCINEAPKAVS